LIGEEVATPLLQSSIGNQQSAAPPARRLHNGYPDSPFAPHRLAALRPSFGLFIPCSLFPIPYSLFPTPCSPFSQSVISNLRCFQFASVPLVLRHADKASQRVHLAGPAASSLPLDVPQIAARHARGDGALAHGAEVYRQRTFAVETAPRAHPVASPGIIQSRTTNRGAASPCSIFHASTPSRTTITA
jgi:hypothetical protein